MRDSESTTWRPLPSGVAPPDRPVLPPCGTSGTGAAAHRRTTAATSIGAARQHRAQRLAVEEVAPVGAVRFEVGGSVNDARVRRRWRARVVHQLRSVFTVRLACAMGRAHECGHQLDLARQHRRAGVDTAAPRARCGQQRRLGRLHDDLGHVCERVEPRHIQRQRIAGTQAERGAVDHQLVARRVAAAECKGHTRESARATRSISCCALSACGWRW